MMGKGGTFAWVGLAGVLVLGGCATPGEPGPEAEQAPEEADGPPLAETEAEGASSEGLGRGETAEGAALGKDARAEEPEPAIQRPEEQRVFFDFDSTDLSDEARERLRAHAEYLKANPGVRVTLEGHADERGSREYNLGLGERRAKSVRRILLVHGVGSERLEVVSFGEERPLVEGDDEAAYARNRRVKLAYDGSNGEG